MGISIAVASLLMAGYAVQSFASTATAGTTDYSVSILSTALSATVSSSQGAPSVDESTTGNMISQDDNVILENSSQSTAVYAYAQLGAAPSGLTEESGASALSANQFAVMMGVGQLTSGNLGSAYIATSSATAPTELPTASTSTTPSYATIPASSSAYITADFIFGASTTPGTYTIPVSFTIES